MRTKRRNRTGGLTAAASTLTLLLSSSAMASDLTIEVSETAVNNMLRAVGTVSGETAKIKTTFLGFTVYNQAARWTIHDMWAELTAGAVTVHAQLDVSYGGTTNRNLNVTTTAQLAYDPARRVVQVMVDEVSFPFEVLVFRRTVTVDPGLTVEYPLGPVRAKHLAQDGGMEAAHLLATSVLPSVDAGKIVLRAEVMSW